MTVEVQIKKHPRARHLTLRYQPHKGHFVLTTPRRTSRKEADAFLADQRLWMREQQQCYPKPQALQPGDELLYLGKKRCIEHTEGKGVHVEVKADSLCVTCRIERFPRTVQRFLKQQAAQTLTPLIYQKAEQIGKQVAAITFRNSTSRWGSCTRSRRLSFSWRLIMAPMEAIDYVVAHEVAHLKHFNHQEKFWSLCRDLSSDYDFGKKWLHENAAQLYINI